MNIKQVFVSLVLFANFAVQANIDDIKECRSVESDKKRLVCYDDFVASITNTQDKVTDNSKPTPKLATHSDDVEIPDTNKNDAFVATVSKIKKDPYGVLTIYLDNEQIWKQAASSRFRLKVNDQVKVESAALGSFMLNKIGSNKTIRVKRLQ